MAKKRLKWSDDKIGTNLDTFGTVFYLSDIKDSEVCWPSLKMRIFRKEGGIRVASKCSCAREKKSFGALPKRFDSFGAWSCKKIGKPGKPKPQEYKRQRRTAPPCLIGTTALRTKKTDTRLAWEHLLLC